MVSQISTILFKLTFLIIFTFLNLILIKTIYKYKLKMSEEEEEEYFNINAEHPPIYDYTEDR